MYIFLLACFAHVDCDRHKRKKTKETLEASLGASLLLGTSDPSTGSGGVDVFSSQHLWAMNQVSKGPLQD